MKIVELKCWPAAFQALWDDDKKFEIRKEDRETFVPKDTILHLREFDPYTNKYMGREILADVPYLVRGPAWGGMVPEGVVIMSINIFHRHPKP